MSSGIRRGPPECVDLPLAQPTPAPRADHSDFSEETLIAYLDRLEGWKPTEEDKDLSKEWIEWLDKVRQLVLILCLSLSHSIMCSL